MDTLLNLTPAEVERYSGGYYLSPHFTNGYDDTVLGYTDDRRPPKSDIKATRAYNYGREMAFHRSKHHHIHRGSNHSHECEFCHFKWWHSEKSLDCFECHTCPNCGAVHQDVALLYGSLEEEKRFLMAKINNLVENHRPTAMNLLTVGWALDRIREIDKSDEVK